MSELNDKQIIDRARRAETLRNEFLAPVFGDIRQAYANRIVEIAATELDPKIRAEKITALSSAIRILGNLETGINAFIRDGEVAKGNLLRVEKIESMTAPQRRLFGIAPY